MAGTTTGMCESFKKELLLGYHAFLATSGDVFKLALVKVGPTGTYGVATANYTDLTGNSDEAADTSGNAQYISGGFTMTPNADPALDTTNHVAYIDWATDPNWGPAATISATGAILYNSSIKATVAGRAVAVFDFSGTKTTSTGTFLITLPPPAYNSAVLRIA